MRGFRALAVAAGVLALGCADRSVQEAEIEDPDAPTTPASVQAEAGADWGDLYDQGIPFSSFLEAADRRRETWHENFDRAQVPAEVLERAQEIPGEWRVLVVAEDWCGDSAHTIPYVARLVEEVAGLEMRVVNSEVGKAVMEAYRTPDDRGATPTVVILNGDGRQVGCWVERPAALQEWFLDEDRSSDKLDRKYAWYNWDLGESTVAEVTAVIAGAAAGSVVCETPAAS